MLKEDLPFCRCGCGERVRKVGNQFIHGHPIHVLHPMQIPEAREKLSKSLTGRIFSKEHRENISKAASGRITSKETKRKMSKAHSGKCFSKEHKQKIGVALKKRIFSDETKRKMSISAKGKIISPEARQKISLAVRGENHPLYGKHLSAEHKKKISVAMKRNYLNPDFVCRYREGLNIHPNRAELKLQKLLNKHFPKEYRFVGNFMFVLGGKCPDFLNVNGQKKLIELYGDFWHRNDCFETRVNFFKQFGFFTLVIWESELKDKNILVEKIRRFNDVEASC